MLVVSATLIYFQQIRDFPSKRAFVTQSLNSIKMLPTSVYFDETEYFGSNIMIWAKIDEFLMSARPPKFF